MADAFENMDKMYRHQRYFYDLTRKYYLLGRDRLLKEMRIADGENVLEAGCGLGQYVILLRRRGHAVIRCGAAGSIAVQRGQDVPEHGLVEVDPAQVLDALRRTGAAA